MPYFEPSGITAQDDGVFVITGHIVNFDTGLDVSIGAGGVIEVTATGGGGGGSALEVQQDGTPVDMAVVLLNFIGRIQAVENANHEIDITIDVADLEASIALLDTVTAITGADETSDFPGSLQFGATVFYPPDVLANRPAAGATIVGAIYFATDGGGSAGQGILYRSDGTSTWTAIAINKGYADALYQALDGDLTAIAALSSTGIAVRSAANTWVQRTITGTTNRVVVTDGSGVSGNPTLDIGTDVVTLTGSQTLTGKTLTAPVIADYTNAQHDHLDADDGGTLDASAIGSGTLSNSRLDTDLGEIAALTRTRGDLIIGGTSAWTDMAVGASGTLLRSDGTDPAWASLATAGIQPLDPDLTDIAALTRTRGDLIVGGASAWVDKAIGASGTLLQSDGTDPQWVAPADILTSAGYTALVVSDPGRTRASSAAELTLLNGTAIDFPANSLVVGDVVRWETHGTITHSEGSNRTFTLKVKLDANNVVTVTTANIATGVTASWTFQGYFRVVAVGSGTNGVVLGGATFRLTNNIATTTLQEITPTVFCSMDTTQALTLDFTNTNSVSSANFSLVGNDICFWKSNAP